MSVARFCGWSELPEMVLTMLRVKVEGSDGPGTQVMWKGELRSTVVPEKGAVNVRAREVVAKARRVLRLRILVVNGDTADGRWSLSVLVALQIPSKECVEVLCNAKSGQHKRNEGKRDGYAVTAGSRQRTRLPLQRYHRTQAATDSDETQEITRYTC